jgi:hypothetical protein
MEWSTVVLALVTGSVAIVATLLGSWVQHRFATSRAASETREQRVRDVAAILAQVDIVLSDGDPDRLGINVQRRDPHAAWRPLYEEWTTKLRPELATLALGDESAEVRKVGRELVVAVSNYLTSTAWFLRDLVSPDTDIDVEKRRQTAREDHLQAKQLSTLFMELMRR